MPESITDATYHVSIWDDPPTYVCLVCNAVGMTVEGVTAHLQQTHGLPALPTPMIPALETMRAHAATQTEGSA